MGAAACGMEMCGAGFQLVAPPLQLAVLVALTRDKGSSFTARVCLSWPARWLGRVSMALYLVHVPVMQYFMLLRHGPMTQPGDGTEGYCHTRPVTLECHERRELWRSPLWCILGFTVVSLLLSDLLEKTVQGSARICARARRSEGGVKVKSHVRGRWYFNS